jgi:flagellar motor switch protein FliN/FliY
MPADAEALLKLEVPFIVQLGTKRMSVREVTALTPGTIVELPINAEDDLKVLVKNKVVGLGRAVKVGENYGVRITYVGDLNQRMDAVGGESAAQTSEADRLAEQLLAGQI